jgi:type I restriction enzyme R subunit
MWISTTWTNTPFDAKGGRGKMWQLFGDQMETILSELNDALAA